MMIRLYYSNLSANSKKVHLALEEVGADYEIVHLDLLKGEQRRSEYLELNPNGKVPTVVDGDFVLWESNAILGYLAEKYPLLELVPQDRLARARTNQLLFWQATVLGPSVAAVFRESRLKPAERRTPEAIERARVESGPPLAMLGALLGARPHAVGERLTIADLSLGPYAQLAVDLGLELPKGAASWLDMLHGRPSWNKVYPTTH